MKQIRIGVFETNSSSTHTLVVCTDEELEKWKKGEMVYEYGEGLVPSNNTDTPSYGETFEYFMNDDYLEVNLNTYVTKGGEKLNIICKHGYDG